ncbi:Anaphase-promoting complex subunit 2 [Tieghemiomyces parasiticus]|uniref:Anaphase-promoting complex subunit 2 n=1 Tax=Tieghemiomyces parasiticus TaxID=78921 RepID=A0A9W8A502_9FUNG|nr:Anaphase-promoting complex subunit 2 [Tieghemiomyces parasiticus]
MLSASDSGLEGQLQALVASLAASFADVRTVTDARGALAAVATFIERVDQLRQTYVNPRAVSAMCDQISFEARLFALLPANFQAMAELYLTSGFLLLQTMVKTGLPATKLVADLFSIPEGTDIPRCQLHEIIRGTGWTGEPEGTMDTASEDSNLGLACPPWLRLHRNVADWIINLDYTDRVDLLGQLIMAARPLRRTGLQRFIHRPLYALALRILDGEIRDRTDSVYDTPQLLGGLAVWTTERLLVPWLTLVAGIPPTFSSTTNTVCSPTSPWHAQLLEHLHTAYRDARVAALFDIIIDYPDSRPALDDLRTCFAAVGGKMAAAAALRTDVVRRLLHQGVNTPVILAQYVSCMKCLRALDPTGVMAQYVTAPIRTYLRTREDAIRCIIANLVGDEDGLFDEADLATVLDAAGSDDEDNDFDRDDWEPEPMDALTIPKTARQRKADIIGMLISIYDTREAFVREYQRLLAWKLLDHEGDDLTSSIKNLEMVKLRFGEANLAACEIMVKDVADSKRINQFVQERERTTQSAEPTNLNCRIISHLFWPTLRPSNLKLPAPLAARRSQFEALYTQFKPARSLHWHTQMGTIDVTVTQADRQLTLTVTPLQATLLHHFSERGEWTTGELADCTDIPADQLHPPLAFWVSAGVIEATEPDRYRTLESAPKARSTGRRRPRDEDTDTSGDNGSDSDESDSDDDPAGTQAAGNDSGMESEQDRKAEEMRIYWSFVVGMLTNLGALPLDRIQSMLQMFVQEPASYSRTEAELKDFLALMVKEDKLELSGGMYRLK